MLTHSPVSASKRSSPSGTSGEPLFTPPYLQGAGIERAGARYPQDEGRGLPGGGASNGPSVLRRSVAGVGAARPGNATVDPRAGVRAVEPVLECSARRVVHR